MKASEFLKAMAIAWNVPPSDVSRFCQTADMFLMFAREEPARCRTLSYALDAENSITADPKAVAAFRQAFDLYEVSRAMQETGL